MNSDKIHNKYKKKTTDKRETEVTSLVKKGKQIKFFEPWIHTAKFELDCLKFSAPLEKKNIHLNENVICNVIYRRYSSELFFI